MRDPSGNSHPAAALAVWRIDPGARNVTCPSTACTVAFDGLTSDRTRWRPPVRDGLDRRESFSATVRTLP